MSEAKELRQKVKAILERRYDGKQTRMADDLPLSAATVSRAMDLSSDYGLRTRIRNLKTILNELKDLTDEEKEIAQADNLVYGTEAPNYRSVSLREGGEAIAVPFASFKASAGDGNYVVEEKELDTYIIDRSEISPAARKALKQRGMFVVEVEGDSMTGDLEPGDRVIVERTPDPKQILTDAIYLIRIEGTIMFKALQQRPGGQLLVISRKDSYPNYEVDPETSDFEVIGKVWGRFERLG